MKTYLHARGSVHDISNSTCTVRTTYVCALNVTFLIVGIILHPHVDESGTKSSGWSTEKCFDISPAYQKEVRREHIRREIPQIMPAYKGVPNCSSYGVP